VTARFSTPVQIGLRAHPASCTMGTGSFPEVKSCRGVDPSPPSSAVGHERVELYLYFPYGLYGMYRASVPVQGCTLSFYLLSYHTPKQQSNAQVFLTWKVVKFSDIYSRSEVK